MLVEECWASMTNKIYGSLSSCQVKNQNQIILRNLYLANIDGKPIIDIYAKIKLSLTQVTMVTKLYSRNGVIESNRTVDFMINKLNGYPKN